MYDLAILGGGPAAVSAGVYASRKQLKTIFITETWGGQSTVSDGIENWIGTVSIPGPELAKNLEEHLKAYAKDIVTIKEGVRVEKVEKADEGFLVTAGGEQYKAKTVLVATGSHRRKLEVPGAEQFDNKGITYCASCDGPLFSGMEVAVIGGGNAGFETAAQLLAYTKHVTLLQRSGEYRADPITVEKVLAHPNMTGITNTEILEVKGDKFAKALVYKKTDTGETVELPASGIFVEIGALPSVGYLGDLVDLTDYKQVKIDPWTQKTSCEGIWAAGDCTNALYHQNNIAAGDAVKALEDIYMHLHGK
ncbi:MAG: FAD-dependent oxidoreductase [Candidatus Paceibacterota bacterium]